jgi:hypothetical protein
MRSIHAKFYEFSMHRKGDIDLSLFSFSKVCRLNEQELRITYYMKDVVLYEGISTKFILYFLELYFILYGFSKFMNQQIQNLKTSFFFAGHPWGSLGCAALDGTRGLWGSPGEAALWQI